MATCFVIMPFGTYFDGYYADVIRPALTSTGIACVRADEIYGTGVIVEDIHKEIARADICLADVTGRNPNVSYELGMAHALRKPVLLLTQDIADVPFDYRHLRLISYDPKLFGWENDFRRRIVQTVIEALKNPTANLALRPTPTDEDAMRQHLANIFSATSYDLERTNQIYCDEQGHCRIKTFWKVKANSPIYHLCHNIVSDVPGRIEVHRVHDKLNARDLDYVVVEKGTAHLSYFFLFKQFKASGQKFEVETDVLVEGYIDLQRFLEKGETMMSTQAVALGIRYISKADWLYLPKTSRFAGVYAEYLSHPRPECVGSRIAAIETNDHYLVQMTYDAEEPYQQETAATLRLPRSAAV